jgi:hypothetical protein
MGDAIFFGGGIIFILLLVICGLGEIFRKKDGEALARMKSGSSYR